jgi:hypothetical protein
MFIGGISLLVMGIPPDRPYEDRDEVAPDQLSELFDRATSVSIVEGGEVAGWWPKTLYRSWSRSDLDSLKHAIRVERPPQTMACKCEGGLAIRLYRGPNCIAEITSHHTHLVRTHLWKSDGKFVEPEAFLRWCDAREITGPRIEWDRAEQRRRREQQEAVVPIPNAARP